MTKPRTDIPFTIANQLAWFQRVAERFRLILSAHREVEADFELAWERALGSLDREERRRWRKLFVEYKDQWEEAFNREGIEPEPDVELLQLAYAAIE